VAGVIGEGVVCCVVVLEREGATVEEEDAGLGLL
jgi:hypothetical protein